MYPQYMNETARNVLAINLRKLMEQSPDLCTQSAIAKKSGVAQTTIGYMLRSESLVKAPNLDNVEKIARVFGLEAWQLLHPSMGDREIKAKELELYRRFREELAKINK